MQIVIDASAAVHARAGVGRYAQELITALLEAAPEHAYRILFNRPADANPQPPLDSLPQTRVELGDKPWRLRVLLAHLLRRSQDRLLSVDTGQGKVTRQTGDAGPPGTVLHAADHLLPWVSVPTVFTLFDLTHHLYPKTQATLNRWYLKLTLGRFLHRAQAVIAISEATRASAIQHYHLPPEKVYAIPLGVHPRFQPASQMDMVAIRNKYRLPEAFLLAVGTIEPRKNLGVLLEALRQDPALSLVLAGRRGWLSEPFFKQLETSGCQSRVHLLGYTPEDDLPALYSAARLFVFPSLYEGFGLPVLEAMACGAPVICSNTSSLPEVAGEAALLVNPTDAHSVQSAITRAWRDETLRADLRRRGERQAARFTWQSTARQTLAVYRSVLKASNAA